MKNETIHFELVSPEAKLVSEPVKMVVIPGEEGEMGIGAKHAAFVVALKAGVVKLYQNDGKVERSIFIAGGFADITGDHCTVLAEEAINISDIDKAELEQLIQNYKEDLTLTEEHADRARLRYKISILEAKKEAIAA